MKSSYYFRNLIELFFLCRNLQKNSFKILLHRSSINKLFKLQCFIYFISNENAWALNLNWNLIFELTNTLEVTLAMLLYLILEINRNYAILLILQLQYLFKLLYIVMANYEYCSLIDQRFNSSRQTCVSILLALRFLSDYT